MTGRTLETLVPVAEGAIGRVYRARDPETGQVLAVKVLRHDDPTLVERLRREAAAQQRLDHPNICRVHGLQLDDGGRWQLLMEFIEGSTLGRELDRLSLDTRIELLEVVCRAVAHAHEHGILHRDLKPANILLRSRANGGWDPVVADFGLALSESDPALTTTGEILGSPAYMSPEQARGTVAAIDGRSDVFSVGCILYEALTGAPPFEAQSVSASLERLLGEDATHPRRINPHAPEPLSRIALQCLERNPDMRYPGMQALAEDLARWRARQPVQARAYTRFYRFRRRIRRHPMAASLGAVALLTITALVSWGAWTTATAALREEAAAELGTALADMRGRMSLARLAPSHDIGTDRIALRAALDELRDEHAQRASTADLLHATLAAGHLEIGDLDRAEQHAERALSLRDTPATRAIRARTMLARYAATVAPLMDLPAQQRDERLAQARSSLLEPAQTLIEPLAGTRNEPAAALARLAVLERRFDEAAGRIDALQRENPQDYAPELLAASLDMARAEAALKSADREAAARLFERAQNAFDAITTIGRSDPRPRLQSCRAARGRLRATMDQGGPFPQHPAALGPGCAQLVDVDPGNPDIHAALAAAFGTLAEAFDAINEKDAARQLVRGGIDSTDRALVLASRHAPALEQRARLFLRLAGLEPDPWTRAQAHFDTASDAARSLRETRPDYPVGQLLTALIERDRARHLELHGQPEAALASLGAAQEAFEAVLARTPDSVVALSGAALNAVFHFYEYRTDDPQRAVGWMERAIALQDRALAQDPDNVDLLFDQGANYGDFWYFLLLAPEAQSNLSRDELLERAISLLARIRELAPQRPTGYSQPIMILLSGADHSIDRGRDASAALARALELKRAADRAGVALDRNLPAWIHQARVRNVLAQGGDAGPVFETAFAVLDHADVDPSDRFYQRIHRLELIGLYQRWLRETGRPPDHARFDQAHQALNDLLANDRRQAGVLCSGGRVLLEEALAERADADLVRAESLFQSCLATDDNFTLRYEADLDRVRELLTAPDR